MLFKKKTSHYKDDKVNSQNEGKQPVTTGIILKL